MTLSTNISLTQRRAFRQSTESGLSVLAQPEPLTCVEWANENFYLSSESSYSEGKWETAPFQVAILNAMGNDDVPVVDLIKSARIGYTKMLLANMGYTTEHKKRNQMLWQPTDSAAAEFMKQHVETMIRDVPTLRALAPWEGKKDRDNTLDYKRFTNRKQLFIKGGASAKNYREKSVDTVYYDELSSFEPDIEKEGDARTLGDKRTEGSVYPKSIRGSTPKSLPECQISQAVEEAEVHFRRFVPCPHCNEEQHLVWGGKDIDHGLKFETKQLSKKKQKVTKCFYLCKHCQCVIGNNDLHWMDTNGRYKSECGVWTKDGINYFDLSDTQIEAPKHIAFHIWTIFSPWSPWLKIAQDFVDKKNNEIKLKGWVNTTLGEAWVTKGEKLDHVSLYARREHYVARLPKKVIVLTAGVDIQDDRIEISVYGYGGSDGSEKWCICHYVLRGDLAKPTIWKKLDEFLLRSFEHESGIRLKIAAAAVDTGGHFTQQVYKFCKKRADRNVYAIKGANKSGQPIVTRPTKNNLQKVDLYSIGTDTAKDSIYSWLKVLEPGENYVHFPMSENEIDEEFFEQLTAEKRETKYKNGFPFTIYIKTRTRNEALDCFVYSVAAIEILRPNWRVLSQAINAKAAPKKEKENEPPQTSIKSISKKRRKASMNRRKKSYVKGYK